MKRLQVACFQRGRGLVEDARRQIAFGAQGEQRLQDVGSDIDQVPDGIPTAFGDALGHQDEVEGRVIDERRQQEQKSFMLALDVGRRRPNFVTTGVRGCLLELEDAAIENVSLAQTEGEQVGRGASQFLIRSLVGQLPQISLHRRCRRLEALSERLNQGLITDVHSFSKHTSRQIRLGIDRQQTIDSPHTALDQACDRVCSLGGDLLARDD